MYTLLCMIKARIRWCTCRVENILTLGKLLSLWFCFLLHSILFLISQTSYRTYKIISSYELARLVMGTIFLVWTPQPITLPRSRCVCGVNIWTPTPITLHRSRCACGVMMLMKHSPPHTTDQNVKVGAAKCTVFLPNISGSMISCGSCFMFRWLTSTIWIIFMGTLECTRVSKLFCVWLMVLYQHFLLI